MAKIIRNRIKKRGKNAPARSESETDIISHALRLSGGNHRIASFILGVKPSILNKRIREFKLKEKKNGNISLII